MMKDTPTMPMGTRQDNHVPQSNPPLPEGLVRVGPALPGPAKATLEVDPSGKSPNQAGAKLDAGKVMPSLIIEGMARAIWGIAEVATFGAQKYSRNGWVLVEDGPFRYTNAGYRHVLKRAMGEQLDPESHLDHLKHEAWNALAKLDLALRQQEDYKSNLASRPELGGGQTWGGSHLDRCVNHTQKG